MTASRTGVVPLPAAADRWGTFSFIAFLVVAAVGFFADGVRVRIEGRDPSELPAVANPVPRLSRRVVLVVVDSLPVRVGTDPDVMPHLVALAGRGAAGVMIAPPETVTTAGVRAMSVGASPSFRDTLDMFSSRPFSRWTVFDDLVARGEGVAFFGDHVWSDLLGDRAMTQAPVRSQNLFADDAAALAGARERLRAKDRTAFLVLHIGRTDFLAHQYGTQREEYKEKLREVDAQLQAFYEAAAGPGTTFIVTSDHGNDLYGSHGGGGDIYRRVPVVLAGAGIRPLHGFELQGQQLPLALAALLGTRLPGGILQPRPPAFLDMPDSAAAGFALADLTRLESLADFLEADPSAARAAAGAARKALSSGSIPETIRLCDRAERVLLDGLASSSKPDPGMFAWVVALYLAMALVYLATVARVPGRSPGLGLGYAALALLAATSRARLPALAVLVSVEAALVAGAVAGMRTARQRAGTALALACAGAIVVVSGLRFVLGGAFLLSRAEPLAAGAALALPAVLWSLRGRRNEFLAAMTGAELAALPVILFALGVFQPVELVPVLLCTVLLLGLRANRLNWLQVAVASAGAMLFFLLSQRLAFAWTGERPWARYSYTLVTGSILVLLGAGGAGTARRWMAPAMLSLLPLWAFGFVSPGRSWDTSGAQTVLALASLAATGVFFWRAGCLRSCAFPLATALVYHLEPSGATFWLSLAAHLAFVVAAALSGSAREEKSRAVAGLMLSVLYLMSSGADFLSVLLFSLVLFVLSDSPSVEDDETALVLFGAVLVTYVRYGILNSFGHTGSPPYAFSNLDTHSGFAAMREDVQLWIPTTLVVGKMLCASILVYSLVLLHPRLRRHEGRLILASLALVMAFLVEAALELALSFGANEGRLSMSTVQVIFHAGILVLLAGGYAGYKLLLGPRDALAPLGRAP